MESGRENQWLHRRFAAFISAVLFMVNKTSESSRPLVLVSWVNPATSGRVLAPAQPPFDS
jgi:hypothetical protein